LGVHAAALTAGDGTFIRVTVNTGKRLRVMATQRRYRQSLACIDPPSRSTTSASTRKKRHRAAKARNEVRIGALDLGSAL